MPLAADLFPLSRSDNQDDQPVSFHLADDLELAHTVPPQFRWCQTETYVFRRKMRLNLAGFPNEVFLVIPERLAEALQ